MITAPLKNARQVAQPATLRNFDGGWNTLDDDLNLNTKFSTRLYNMALQSDGSIATRMGTRLFADCQLHFSSTPTFIVNITYFSNSVVVVGSNGDVLYVLGDGTITRIWDATIAHALPGTPAGWSTTSFASFAQFNNDLIVCNGVDKPLIVNAVLHVDYLQDLATLTNINTPVARYVVSCDRYLVMAGDPVNPYRIHISAKDASGTWFGDPAPNDATFIDVGSILNGASLIRGICSFRGQLVIGFAEGTVLAQLGNYVADAHVPTFEDPIEQYGGVSHRSMVSTGDDMLMQDLMGVPSLKRTVFTGTLRPERVSDLIGHDFKAMIDQLDFGSIEDRCFAVYDQVEGQFMFFVPNTNDITTTSETKAFVRIYRPSLSVDGWERFDGWNFTCGCRTGQDRIIFGDKNGKLWIMGSNSDPVYADFVGDASVQSGTGQEINWDWELPWSDIKRRMLTKKTTAIAFDTHGTAVFSVRMYTDRYLSDQDGNDAPALQMSFTAGDAGGFGVDETSYGGGRNTAYGKLYKWPAKFQLMKLRMSGSTKAPVRFVAVSLLYKIGNFFR